MSERSHPTTPPPRDVWDVLPQETLEQVILFASPLGCGDDPEKEDVVAAQATVVSCTRVCRAWRGAAFSQRELWATMVDVKRQSIEALCHTLEISSPYPFVVGHRSSPVLMYDPEFAVSVLSLLCEHEARIQGLHITIRTAHDDPMFPEIQQLTRTLAELQMPRIEALTWFQEGPQSSGPLSEDVLVQPRPEHVNLKRACISGAALLSTSSTLGLTELTIMSPRHRPTCLEVMQFLRCTPNLQFLHLADAVDPSGAIAVQDFKPPNLTLPLLALVNIEANSADQMTWMMVVLRGCLSGASTRAAFAVRFPGAPPGGGFIRAEKSVVRLLGRTVPPNKRYSELQVVLLDPEGGCVLSTLMADDPQKAMYFADKGSRWVLENLRTSGTLRPWTIRTGAIGIERSIRLLRDVNLDDITSLKIAAKYSQSNVHAQIKLGQGLRLLPNLTKITLVDEAAANILPLLSIPPGLLGGPSDTSLFPRLRHVELDLWDSVMETRSIEALGPALERRWKGRLPIREVTFVQPCTCMDKMVELGRRLGCRMSFQAASS